ncbi:MAG: family N-acetyltransferase [Candidatus Sulfotelmatobacter sp.]|nr:family N-acetyltransferase [Candidatus Sulfotelmatobacter sp.]
MAPKQEPSRFAIEPLDDKHDRAAFSCGVEALDAYLHKQAGQDARKRAAVPFVATADGKTIAGYYTLAQYAIQLDTVPDAIAKKLPKYPTVSATLLGRLAVSTEFRGQRVGETLLMDALHRSLTLGKQAASAGVIADAKDDSAVSFYRKYGFLDLPKVERRLFLPMGTVEQLFR